MEITETFYPKSRAEWRNWLKENHESKTEIWMITPRKDTKMLRVPYDDAVEEALCFGWIDGIAKTFDENSSAQRYTPRRKKSFLSELNRQRIWKLQELNLMTPKGIEPIKDQIGSPDDEFDIPNSILTQLQQDKTVWENFQNFSKNYQRLRIGFVMECIKQNPTESQKRLDNLIKMTAQNKIYGTIVV
jgi:uncharacterized protein YdeI (YjbR/CyaY-like superfamily)